MSRIVDAEPCLPEGLLFPMWVLPVKTFLEMEGPPKSHQELMEEMKLLQWRPGMFCVFVSHQWLSNTMPDPEGEQVEELRSGLRAITSDSLPVATSIDTEIVFKVMKRMSVATRKAILGGYLWLDWWGVPQITQAKTDTNSVESDMIKAVMSIPAYVQACDLFVVLCPPRLHKNTGSICNLSTWKSRGWCRAEMAFRALSPRMDSSEIIILTSRTQVVYGKSAEWMQHPVGEGVFTVDSDRDVLHSLIQRAIDEKIAFYALQGNKCLFEYRFFVGIRKQMLSGFPEELSFGLELEVSRQWSNERSFLRKYKFNSMKDRGTKGFGPLFCAALENNPALIMEAVQAGADIHQELDTDLPELFIKRGAQTLGCCVLLAGGWEAASCLVTANANVNHLDDFGLGPLYYAMLGPAPPRVAMVTLLLESRADLEVINGVGGTALLGCCYASGTAETVNTLHVLLQHSVNLDPNDFFGSSPLHYVALFTGEIERTRFLLEAKCPVDRRGTPCTFTTKAVIAACKMATNYGAESQFTRYLAEIGGSTPLCIAAMFGHSDMCKILLQHRADPTITNDRGHSPLDLASIGHHERVITGLRRSLSLRTRLSPLLGSASSA